MRGNSKMTFENLVQSILDLLSEKKVIYKTSNKYKVTELFDFVFRGHLAMILLTDDNPTHFEINVEFAISQTLDHFKLPHNELTIRTIRTFQSDKTYNKIFQLLGK